MATVTKKATSRRSELRGGVRAGDTRTHAWRWNGAGGALSNPVRCRREQWYLIRGCLANGHALDRAQLRLRFLKGEEPLTEQVLDMRAASNGATAGNLLAWVQSPDTASRLQLGLTDESQADWFSEVVFHPVEERDPKCHPLANVPRWSTLKPAFPIDKVILPPALAALAEHWPDQKTEVLKPRSATALLRAAREAACVLDPEWIQQWDWKYADVLKLAEQAWVLVDLETVWRLLRKAQAVPAALVTERSQYGIMSARVEYSDVHTRGFALQDVFPFSTIDDEGGFSLRVIRADRAWKRFADEHSFATLLASETPDPKACGDVISAALPVGRGELIATDLPWLVGERSDTQLAPHLAAHALRMHLGAPLPDHIQHWNRWDDAEIVVRDIADLSRRYAPLQAVRWAAPSDELVSLGIALPALDRPRSTLLIHTGRIDLHGPHDGIPPEPMTIFMKLLGREVREKTAWARRVLRELNVIWQFDSATGWKYASYYTSAATALRGKQQALGVRIAAKDGVARGKTPANVVELPAERGVLGDESLAFQDHLHGQLIRRIEAAARAI